jgi:hypothetical protein
MRAYIVISDKDNNQEHKFAIHSDEWDDMMYSAASNAIAQHLYANHFGETESYTIYELVDECGVIARQIRYKYDKNNNNEKGKETN